jgi:hypothetical protein
VWAVGDCDLGQYVTLRDVELPNRLLETASVWLTIPRARWIYAIELPQVAEENSSKSQPTPCKFKNSN